MQKKIAMMFLIVSIFLVSAIPAMADEAAADGFVDEFYRVVDMADLLTDSDEATLIACLDEISIRQKMDVVIATTDDLEGWSVRDYADLLYEQCYFGYGYQKDGLMLLISMEDHDWYITTCGYGITAFTDAGIEYIGEQITPSLSEGNYVGAFERYAELCDDFITQARNGVPYDRGNLPRHALSLVWIPISLLIGFIIAKIAVGNMKGKLKTVRAQNTADHYVRDGSMKITESRELFLYRTLTRTAKSNGNSSGSSTHRSPSGTTHGGGGGKF